MNQSRIVNRLAYHAAHNANKTAIAMRNKRYTFKELFDKVEVLSSAIDVECKEKPIVVFANRDPDTLVFFLAVVFSGNFYVPVDPDMPVSKIKAIFEETRPPFAFFQDCNLKTIDQLREEGNLNSVFLDDKAKGDNSHNGEISDSSPLYMVYTSGSTGKPKGVLKSHKAMVSFMETFSKTFLTDGDSDKIIIGNQTPFFFDASAKDIYLMIENGATIEIIPSELFVIPPRLIAYLNEKSISFISWVPTALSLVAQMKAFKYVKPECLRKVFFVGEVMPVKYLNYWIQNLPDVSFTNLYGQSEIAGIACYYPVNSIHDEDSMLPIGKPLSNCQVIIMEDGKAIKNVNRVGEILISSPALANGYYMDDEKTKAAFIKYDNRIWFKTGDYAYRDENEDLVFTARQDSQIKHLGRRIELGEIEIAASSIDCVERSCCLYDADHHRIVLFCQAKRQKVMNESNESYGSIVRNYLKEKLAPYMIPEKIVIGIIPINANGKIDRQKLRDLIIEDML